MEVQVGDELDERLPLAVDLELPAIESGDDARDDEPIEMEACIQIANDEPSLLGDDRWGLDGLSEGDGIEFAEATEAGLIDAKHELGFSAEGDDLSGVLSEPEDTLREIDDGGLEGFDDPMSACIDENAFPLLDGDDDDDAAADWREKLSVELPALEESDSSIADEGVV
jgi:hypothetical protein